MKIKVGDCVSRMLAGDVLMELKVTAIDDKLIHCGPWTFDKVTGAEIDEVLGWDNTRTGSYIKMENTNG